MVPHGGFQFSRRAPPDKKAHPANRAFSHTFFKNMQLRFAAVNFRTALPSEYGRVCYENWYPISPPTHKEPALHIFHVDMLRPHAEIPKGYRSTPLPPSLNQDSTYDFEAILSHRETEKGKKSYLVKWKHFSYEECTWEPANNLTASSKLVKAYPESKKLADW